MKIKLIFGLSGVLVGGAIALFTVLAAWVKRMCLPAVQNLISRAMREKQVR
ncbi:MULTISPECIES: hypothetical protein [unclassified Enterobacter cloacae complex]|uniref:hypothetical protein n=1 Tax=unclassified Enterobacter cloacae complex TaxID=2757714 RepID=UPI00210143CD|nr:MULTISPECIES: hypothetical protein [unclassified Enterobacter cloacae complex]